MTQVVRKSGTVTPPPGGRYSEPL